MSTPWSRSPSSRRRSGCRVASSRRSAGSLDPTSGQGPMAWPSYKESVSPDQSAPARPTLLRLPRRTTLPELRSVPVTDLPGVGPRIAAALGDLGIVSIADLVSHYPSRHEDLSNVK